MCLCFAIDEYLETSYESSVSSESEIYVRRNGPHASRKSISKVQLRASQVSLTIGANPKQRGPWIFP